MAKKLLLLFAILLLSAAGLLADTSVGTDRPARVRATVWGAGVVPPSVVTRIAPNYPKLPGRVSGVVILEVWLNELGDVVDVRVLKPGLLGTTDAAVAAVRKWTFKPAQVNRMPVPSVYEVAVSYSN